jgi:hypothetical protein
MAEIQTSKFSEKAFSDRVIDGLFAGLLAGIVMILVMIVGVAVSNQDPMAMLANFSVGQVSSPLNGLLVHLGVSGVYGTIFSILMSLLPGTLRRVLPAWFTGLIFGGILLSIALGILLPGLRSPLANTPAVILITGHLVYGLALGWRVNPR